MEKSFKGFKSELVKCDKLKFDENRTEKSSIIIGKNSKSYKNDKICKNKLQSGSKRKSSKTFRKSNYKYKRRNLLLSENNHYNDLNNYYYGRISEIFNWFLSASRYVRCTKMLDNCSLSTLLVAVIIILGFADMTQAGTCWLKREENGKCTNMYSSNMSEEECCKHTSFAYTDREMSDIERFFAAAIDEGAVCRSCLDSCEAAVCGSGKRCVYRKGRAKCVCAPVCRSSKKNKPKTDTSKSTTYVPAMAHENEKLSFFNFDQLIDREITNSNNNKKPSTSNNNENSDWRWRRGTNNQNALNQKLNHNETDRSASSKRRKNQRKSNLSKRRKHSTTAEVTSIAPKFDDVEQISIMTRTEKLKGGQKNGRIIIEAESSTTASVTHRKALNTSSKNVVLDPFEQSPSQQHHNRHQYKKQQPHHQRKSKQNTTLTTGRRGHHQQSAISLDEKIRNGFFSHGFPYPNTDTPQIAHGRYYNPVCGTDGKTYKTECQLKKRACRRESTTLAVAYRGHCQTSCKLVHCLNNLTCVEDQYAIPHCISCTITCDQDDISLVIDPAKAVCGVDGLTYKSVCDINRVICTTGRSISVAYYGPCQDEASCNNIQCGDKQICLNDLITNKPRCISCSFKCPRKRRPQGQRYQEHKICGTNNLTYHSWCQMRRDSCNTGFYIDVKHVGACHKNSVPQKPEYI